MSVKIPPANPPTHMKCEYFLITMVIRFEFTVMEFTRTRDKLFACVECRRCVGINRYSSSQSKYRHKWYMGNFLYVIKTENPKTGYNRKKFVNLVDKDENFLPFQSRL